MHVKNKKINKERKIILEGERIGKLLHYEFDNNKKYSCFVIKKVYFYSFIIR